MAWKPGMPIRTEADLADWRVWRRDRILTAQRERRAKLRRFDYYPEPDALARIEAAMQAEPSHTIAQILDGFVMGRGDRLRERTETIPE